MQLVIGIADRVAADKATRVDSMILLDDWLLQLQTGALDEPGFRRAVQQSLTDGKLGASALGDWLALSTTQEGLPRALAIELQALSSTAPKTAGAKVTENDVELTLRRAPEVQNQNSAQEGRTEFRTVDSEVGPQDVDVGVVMDRRYELVARLGSGGMGQVFKALDRDSQKQLDPNPYVALKVPNVSLQSDPIAAMALHRENTRARQISHPNVVRTHDFFQDRDTGTYFITMELLVGKSVQRVIDANRSGQPFSEIEAFFSQACDALTSAHERGIVHSDIKPSNLFITDGQELKILDFGIAAPMVDPSGDSRETRFDPRKFGALSPGHACLEMFLGLKAHPSDDVYSLACVLYEWLSGSPPRPDPNSPLTPIPANDPVAATIKPRPIRYLSAAQNRALRRALALRRADRTQSVAEFLEDMTAPRSRARTAKALAAGVIATAIAVVVIVAGAFPRTHTRDASSAPINREAPAPTYGLAKPQTPSPVAGSQAAMPLTPVAALPDCPGPPSPSTVNAAVSAGMKAQVALTLYPVAVPEHDRARAALQHAVRCLRTLAAAGYSSHDSRDFLLGEADVR